VKQLRHSQAYERKAYKQTEKFYKRAERSLSLMDHWIETDKYLSQKNDYERVLDQLKNTKLKGLTHEQMGAVEKQWNELFGKGVR
jgi:transposase